ncbi:hypothetical protein RJT34_15749 [Clitoria ternatea]|uniref:Uncharacterized protein n=1 Tax=Clitoria ternatea TaxID=43366 RepID=A0AAN9PBQ3_CLITE
MLLQTSSVAFSSTLKPFRFRFFLFSIFFPICFCGFTLSESQQKVESNSTVYCSFSPPSRPVPSRAVDPSITHVTNPVLFLEPTIRGFRGEFYSGSPR